MELPFDEAMESPMDVSLCGNHIVEPGEECDCGMNATLCDDPCCYPAIISDSERAANISAKSCQRTSRAKCLTPPGLLFGFYLPWAVILATLIILGIVLRHDWYGQKRFFSHITQQHVRIINN